MEHAIEISKDRKYQELRIGNIALIEINCKKRVII